MTSISMSYFLRRALRQHATRTALVAGDCRISYGQLDDMSSRLAAALLGLGLNSGDRLAILLGVKPSFFATEIAAAKAGLIKVPVNTRLSIDEIVKVLRDCGASGAVVDASFADSINDLRGELPALRALVAEGAPAAGITSYSSLIESGRSDIVFADAAASDVYSIRYSGGTTGEPKGIVHTHGAYVAIALSVLREYEVGPAERSLQVTHPAHGANFVWPALLARGAELHLLERYDPDSVLNAIAAHRLTRVPMVPSMWYGVLDHPKLSCFDLSSVETFAFISAPIAVERFRQALELLGPRLVNVYTLSESPVVSTILKKEDLVDSESIESRLASCGREAEDVMLRIVDGNGCEVKAGVVGEIVLNSPGNMLGYWRNSSLTTQTLRDGWVWTGDMARRDEDGYVYLVDRRNDMIITGGFNVFPREVEEILYAHPAVREAAVAGIPHERWGEAVTAFVSLHREAAISEAELMAACAEKLAHYKRPKAIYFLEELPKTSAGKISRRDLTNRFWSDKSRHIG